MFCGAPLFTCILSAFIFLLALRVLFPEVLPTPKFYPKKSLDEVRFFSSIIIPTVRYKLIRDLY